MADCGDLSPSAGEARRTGADADDALMNDKSHRPLMSLYRSSLDGISVSLKRYYNMNIFLTRFLAIACVVVNTVIASMGPLNLPVRSIAALAVYNCGAKIVEIVCQFEAKAHTILGGLGQVKLLISRVNQLHMMSQVNELTKSDFEAFKYDFNQTLMGLEDCWNLPTASNLTLQDVMLDTKVQKESVVQKIAKPIIKTARRFSVGLGFESPQDERRMSALSNASSPSQTNIWRNEVLRRNREVANIVGSELLLLYDRNLEATMVILKRESWQLHYACAILVFVVLLLNVLIILGTSTNGFKRELIIVCAGLNMLIKGMEAYGQFESKSISVNRCLAKTTLLDDGLSQLMIQCETGAMHPDTFNRFKDGYDSYLSDANAYLLGTSLLGAGPPSN